MYSIHYRTEPCLDTENGVMSVEFPPSSKFTQVY